MSFTHTITYSWTDGSGSLSKALSQSAESEIQIDQAAAATGNVNTHDIDVILVASQVKSIYILSDKAVTVSFRKTSDSTESFLVTLAANAPYQWIYSSGLTTPMAHNCNELRVNNPASVLSAHDATVKFRFLIDNAS